MDDRMSQLPQHIVHHIMSFLPPPTDTTRISVLSKYFNSIWRSFPILAFRRSLLYRLTFSEFANSVLKSIASYKTSAPSARLQKFSFESHYSCLLALDGRVDYMLNFALQNKVQELKLDFDRNYTYYCFPEAIFSANQIISLDLRGLRLEPPHITLSCPSIENFSLEDCHGLTSIILRGASLKQVKLIRCPDLRKFHIEGPTSVEHVTYRGRTKWLSKCEMNIASCYKSIKVLELIDEWTGKEWLETHSCMLHNLEKLIVTRCNFRWNNARLCLDKLKSAVLKDCSIEAGEIEAPNLVWFEYWSYNTKVDRRKISISSTSSLLNVKLLFNYDKYYPLDYPASEYLEKLVRPFSNFQKITLACTTYQFTCWQGSNFKEVVLENFDDTENNVLAEYFCKTCKVVRFVKNITATNHPKKEYGLREL
ncbi:hypothetical protein FNV43_RR10221 [Rhamnella rubrinervis]|uniref:F-box domain-containing protein n=1 Tax=Rhamnella rubrinervis TaxID=2594499 RepID=A0A8K0HC86_9ROSA|nr:hypothetical protein FNV43_RR10221 [Rhamnella rubrinervis]